MPDPSRTGVKRLTGSGPAPSIGFLVDWLGDSRYQWQVLRGALKEAHARGAHLLVFVGDAIAPPGQPDPSNAVYELARPKNVDGLIMLSGSLGNRAGLEGLRAVAASHPGTPICSIAIPLPPDASSVCIENAAGMRAAVQHMIQVHGRKRIAFVRGAAASDEAELRLRVYRETLASHGIPHTEELVTPGDWTPQAGKDAVEILFGHRNLPVSAVDAIIAANDMMALGVIDALRERGIRVPEQIAIAGFDDIEEAAFTVPSLTTVRQRLAEQGRDAVRIAVEQIRDGAKPEQATRPAELVIRRSCGCFGGSGVGYRSSAPPGATLGFDSAILRRKQHILTAMARAARGSFGAAGAQWDSRLLAAAAEQIRGDSDDAFLRAYDDVLRRLVAADVDVALCNDVLSALRTRVVRAVGDAGARTKAEDFFHEARIMTSNAIEAVQVSKRMRAWNEARTLMDAGAAIVSARDLAELGQAAHTHLPRAGVARSFIIRISGEPADKAIAQVVVAERPDARKSDAVLSTRYPAVDVLRQVVLQGTDEYSFAVFPTRFGNGDQGLIVLEFGAVEGYGYETLRQVIASALSRIP
jgi:sigma-B regulation protein RsbU (phosphoserine phosphatase)